MMNSIKHIEVKPLKNGRWQAVVRATVSGEPTTFSRVAPTLPRAFNAVKRMAKAVLNLP